MRRRFTMVATAGVLIAGLTLTVGACQSGRVDPSATSSSSTDRAESSGHSGEQAAMDMDAGTSREGSPLGPGGGTLSVAVSITAPKARDYSVRIEAASAECAFATDVGRFSLGAPDSLHVDRGLRGEPSVGPWLRYQHTSSSEDSVPEVFGVSVGLDDLEFYSFGSQIDGVSDDSKSVTFDQARLPLRTEDGGAGTAVVSGTIKCSQ